MHRSRALENLNPKRIAVLMIYFGISDNDTEAFRNLLVNSKRHFSDWHFLEGKKGEKGERILAKFFEGQEVPRPLINKIISHVGAGIGALANIEPERFDEVIERFQSVHGELTEDLKPQPLES